MKKDLLCLRCGTPMGFVMRERLQLGRTGWILGDLPNLLSGALDVDIYCCPECGKMEFYRSDGDNRRDEDCIAQVKCPKCGAMHDMDYPKCPYCKHNYEED